MPAESSIPIVSTPIFLAVEIGDLVAVCGPGSASDAAQWWLGQVIHAEGGARCNANSLFQIACVDSGAIRTVNADAVIEILQKAAGTSALQTGPECCSAALKPAHNHSHQGQRSGQGDQEGNGHGR